MKKTMSVVLALLMIMTMLPISSITSLAATEVADGLLLQEGGIVVDETVIVEITEGYVTLLEFIPTVSGIYQFESYSDSDTYGYLYDSEYNQLESDDDSSSNGLNFFIQYELTAGTTYYFGAKYFSGDSGSFEVTLNLFECEVASLEVKPITVIENTDGYWDTRYNEGTGNYEDYYYYYSWHFDWEYTVTLKDGTVLESDSAGEIYYDGTWYELSFLTNQYETPFIVGENEVAVSILGYETTAIVEIVESPVASVEIEPMVFIENTDGYWDTRYNEKTGNYEDYYYYYSWYFDWDYTVTLKDGTVLESDSTGEIYYNGSWYELNCLFDQYETPLTVGENEVAVSILGYETTAIVEILESPVASIEVKPVTFIENANGYWDTSWYDEEEYYYYELYGSNFEYTVTLKDGTVLNSNYGYVDYNGEEYYLNIHTSQEYNHFTLGENEIEVSILGGSATAIVEIIESPVESIEVEPLTYIEYTNGYWKEEYNWETEEWETTYFYYYTSSHRFDITVNLKDGTVLKANDGYVEYNGTEYYIEVSSNQYENPFTLGENEVTLLVLGYDTTAIVEIVESPVDRIEADPVTITEFTNGEWHVTWNEFDICEYYYRYDVSSFVKFTVVLDDGTVLTPYQNNWGDTCVEYMGEEYDVSFSDDQYSNHWSAGTYSVEIEVLGVTGTAEFEIVSENNSPYGYDEIDGGVVITGVNDTSVERVEIPEEINGKPVVGVASLGTPYATEIIVPDSVKFLSKTWLYNCVSATSVTLGKSVQQLNADMFSTAYALESINVSAENPNFKSVDGVAYTKDGSTLVAFPLGKGDTYTVPAGVSNIDVLLTNSIYRDLNITFADDADGFVTVDGVTYTSDMTAVVFCNPSKTGAYTMPASVTKIYDRAFAESGIESVVVSENVNEIVYGAFADCSSLQSVELPDSVQSIGKQAFANCDALETITLPESITEIGDYAFDECDVLEEITFPESLTEIGYAAFRYCINLSEISIPDSVTELGSYAFYECINLNKATVGNGVQAINESTFGFTGLQEVELPDNLKEINSDAFYCCEKLTDIALPEGLEYIGSYAFGGSGLVSVDIPDSVTELGSGVFNSCDNLQNVTLSNSLTEIPNSCFEYSTALEKIVIPDGVERIDAYAFYHCESLAEVTVPDSVKYVEGYAFSGTAYVKSSANYENGVLYIGKALYTSRNSISGDILVKAGTKSITKYAFEDSNITSVAFPEGMEYIGYAAFRGCSNLTSVTFPSTLKMIDDEAFAGCSKLSDIVLPEGLQIIGDSAFYGTAIESIKIPSTVTDLVYGTFADSDISDIEMPDSAVSMGGHDFDGTPWHEAQADGVVYVDNALYEYKGTMPANTDVTVKDGTLTIAGYAFENQTNLTSITLPEGLVEIGDGTFINCTGLETIIIPDSVKKISFEAFKNCTSLKTVILGSGLEIIEYNAFAGCSSLETIVLSGGKTIGEEAFKGCSSITSLYIPASVEEISISAFAGCSSLAEINVDADNEYYSSIDGILYSKDGTELIYCPTAKTGIITLDLEVEKVADYAFSTAKVTKIVVENTELEIGENAFATANGAYRGEINAILLCAATGSTTETYAESKGQLFEAKGDAILVDDETEITVEMEDNSAFENIVLNVDLLSQIDNEIIYDVTLTNNGVEVQPDGAVIVKIPVPSTMDPAQIKVYHLSDSGNYTNMNAEYIDGFMVFVTDHFSQYVLTTDEKVTIILGDVNGDGKLSAIDARWALQYSAGNRELTAEQIAAADANGDGKVSAIDARWILQASAGNRVL